MEPRRDSFISGRFWWAEIDDRYFGLRMGLNLVEIWLAKAFASCCGVNLAGNIFGGRVLAGIWCLAGGWVLAGIWFFDGDPGPVC
jgi:hypothetical protein